jgi:hypothetical protein
VPISSYLGRMSNTPSDGAVGFGPGETGSTLLREAMAEAVARFPEIFAGMVIPEEPATFKKRLSDLIVEFEARRAASPERVSVARLLAGHVPARTRWTAGGASVPLSEALVTSSAVTAPPAPRPVEIRGTAAPGWVPEVSYRGRTWRGRELRELAARLRSDHQLTEAAASALRWVVDELLGAPVDLSGHRFVLLGAGAELSPALFLLQAGADVLWVDPRPPELDPASFAGTLSVPAASDLLGDPVSVRAAVAAFAAEGPVHLGLYAYAPGGGRELLLTAVMNAIASSLPDSALRSLSMLVSPTTPGEVQPEDQVTRSLRRAQAPRWQRALARTRLLPEPAHHRHGDVEVSRSVVPLQGPTYLAAQYLTKMATAEAWAADRPGVRVSANVAGITHTRSLEHPLFLAGFLGAPTFGIEIFRPEQTRLLTSLLVLHDLLNPHAPSADRSGTPAQQARRLAAQTVHGGVRSVPFVFEHAIRVAAVLGLARKPSLLLRLRP